MGEPRGGRGKHQSSVLRINGSKVTPASGTLADDEIRLVRPFFGYYGGKWRDSVKHYPKPQFETIIEPFAGSAGYSLRYASHNVRLYEIDPPLEISNSGQTIGDPKHSGCSLRWHSRGSKYLRRGALACWVLAKPRDDSTAERPI
jgi:hypothetical protein